MTRTCIAVLSFLAIAFSVPALAAQDVPVPPDHALVLDQTPGNPPPAPPQTPRAGQTPRPGEPRSPNEQRTAPPPPPPPPPETRIAPRPPRGKDLNVQIEVTITDQTGSGPGEKKTVSLMAADQTMGRVRAGAMARKENLGMVGTNLNVDARPMVLENDRVWLEMTIEYRPLRESQVTQEPTNLNESISVILQNGKPMTISQAADPISDRRMTVEVKATILK